MESQPPPSIESYRRIQASLYLIDQGLSRLGHFKFDRGRIVEFGPDRESFRQLLKDGKAFETSGCSDCNRPYYNERPGGTIYNYARPLAQHEIEQALQEIWNGVEVP